MRGGVRNVSNIVWPRAVEDRTGQAKQSLDSSD
jgi:hypothetical protein